MSTKPCEADYKCGPGGKCRVHLAEDEALERELERDIDGIQNRLSLMSGRAKLHGRMTLYYAINRAWREIDAARKHKG